jgi:hypothetical protein
MRLLYSRFSSNNKFSCHAGLRRVLERRSRIIMGLKSEMIVDWEILMISINTDTHASANVH